MAFAPRAVIDVASPAVVMRARNDRQ